MAKYLFPTSMPYDDLTIIDQSAYVETTPIEEIDTIPDGPIAFIPFVSPRGYGEDNKLLYMDSTRLAKYGKPNLKKYGLSLYLANRFVEGGGTLLGMRMMPKDAGYANTCVYAKISEEGLIETVETLTGKYPNQKTIYKVVWTDDTDKISYDSLTITKNTDTLDNIKYSDGKNILFIDSHTSDTDTFDEDDVYKIDDETSVVFSKIDIFSGTPQDENKSNTVYMYILTNIAVDGTPRYGFRSDKKSLKTILNKTTYVEYKAMISDNPANPVDFKTNEEGTYRLFTVRSKAKGSFAKAFEFKITADTTMNSEYPGHFFYKFSSSENGAKLDGDMTFTFDDDCIYGDDCLSVEDVFDKYAANIVMEKCTGDDGFDEFVKKLDLGDYPYEYDILFGTNTSNKFVVKYLDDGYNASEYNTLGGDNLDGKIIKDADFSNFGNPSMKDVYADMFVEAYGGDVQETGIYTDLIYDEVRYPYEYLIIPSYDDSVITAATDLISNRNITRGYFTYPKFNTYKEAREFATSKLGSANCKTFRTSDYCEYWQIKDPYTKKNTMMPSTYFNAYHLPYHWIHSKGLPYAGTRNYRWSGGKVGTMTPCSVNPNEYIANHNVGLNTMIEDGLGYASGYEQITSQQRGNITSQLSENNNATVLMNMARIALRKSSDARWTNLSDEEVNSFIRNVEDSINLSLNGTYRSLRIEGERESVNGAGRNRIHCKLYVNFNDLLKGVTYEFYILAN